MQTIKNSNSFHIKMYEDEIKKLKKGIVSCQKSIDKRKNYPSEKWAIKEYKQVQAGYKSRIFKLKKLIELIKKLK